MSGHTPGPWRSLVEPTDGCTDWCVKAGEVYVASVHPISAAIEPCHGADANARLIAAAPELLEALKEMVRWYGCRETVSANCIDPSDHLLPPDRQNEQCQMAMNAIAKATGAKS